MGSSTIPMILETVRDATQPITGSPGGYDPLLTFIGDASVVLLGVASHGTREFYRSHAQTTERLICEQGFSVIAAKADLPDAYRVNRFIQGDDTDVDLSTSLSGFKRFPTWMWRNVEKTDQEAAESFPSRI